MNYRYDDQQQRQQLLNIVDRGTPEQLFTFLQEYHRQPFQSLAEVTQFPTVIDDQIDFIDCTGTRYNVTPLIIAAGKGSFEKTKILLVHGANPNKQCTTGDTALNLAVHRQKYHIVNLLLQYRANPNLYNQAGKTALHRAVASYSNENAKQIQALLNNGADLYIEDRNQRIPLDEAVVTNKPDIIDLLISYDRGLLQYSYRAAIIASRLGYDKCLEVLLNYGLNPNISDQTNITPLHVAVRSLKPSTARLLLANGANPNIVNNRGETPITIAEFLQPNQKQEFLSILTQNSSVIPSDYQSTNPISYVCPLLQNRSNWTLNSDEFRSPTATNSSVENLLDPTTDTVWCSTQSRGAWVIFDFKHQYNLTGIRIIGCDNHSTPRNGHLDVSNALNGPWLQVKTFTCAFGQGNKTDVFFPSLTTRFIRVFILDNYGGDDIRIQCIGFFGVDTRLINLLQEYRLENSLNTLLANGINDQESLYENQDEILNSSDKYLHVNDHFQFIHLIESLKTPQLTYLEWFVPPQTTAIAGEKFHTFSVTADEDLTDRVKLEEQLENSPQSNVVLMKDLEPIQGHSLVDFSDYVIKQPGRYKIRVVSVESPHIHTTWQEIAVGSYLPYASSLKTSTDEHLYFSSTTQFFNPITSEFDSKDNRTFLSEFDENQSISFQQSPYDIRSLNMSYQTTSNNRSNLLVNYRPGQTYKPEHYTQTRSIDRFDHSTNTDEEFLEGTFNSRQRNSNYFLTPTKYRTITRPPLSNIFSSTNNYHRQQKSQDNRDDDDDDNDSLGYGEKIIIPTKYRLQQERMKRLMNGENLERSRSPPTTTYHRRQPSNQSARTKSHEDNRQVHRDSSPENVENNYYELRSTSQQQSRTQSQIYERRQLPNSSSPVVQQVNQSNYSQRQENYRRNGLKRDSSPLHEQHVPSPSTNRSRKDSSPVRDQIDYYEVDAQSTQSSPTKQSQPRSQRSTSPEQITPIRQRDPSESNQTSHYYELDHSQKRPNSETKISPSQRLDQSPSKPVNNQFKVVAADFELRASPPDENPDSNQSQPPKMELIFKATLQGSDVEKRAQYSISELVTQRSRSQSNTSNLIEPKKTSLANSPDREQINSTDMIPSTYEQDDQTDSNYQSGSYMGQSPLKQTQTDQTQLLITPKHTSNQQITSLDNPIELPLASRQSSTHRPRVENDSTFDGIRERTPSVPRNYIPLVYEKNPFRQTDNSLTSPKLFSPSKSEQRAQYNFGKRAPSHQSDEEEEEREDEEEEEDDDDGFQCETFGHSSQIRPVTNTSAKRNLDFPSTTAPQFSPEKNSNSPKQQIEPSSGTSTLAASSLAQQLKQHFANQGSTENLQQQSQTPLPPRSDDVVQDSYVASPNYTTVTENPSNTTANNLQQQGDSYYYEENQEHEESPQRTEKNKADEQSSQYDDDDNHHNDDSVTDDNEEEEEETNDDDDDEQEGEKNDQDVHDQNQIDHNYTNDVNQYDDSQQSSGNRESGIGVLVQQDPTRDPTSSVAPTQYPPVPKTTTTTTTTVSKTKQKPPKEKKGGFFSFFRGKKKSKQKAQT